MNMQVKSRIAPTPSGFLHKGNAFNFLLTDRLISQFHGSLRLRIDDLDAPRIRAAYLDDIFATLDWLGLSWQDGPNDVMAHEQKFSQQLRIKRYQEVLEQLVSSGQIYACTCSRKYIAEQSTDGQYPGTCLHKKLPLDIPGACWRFNTAPNTIVSFNDNITGHHSIDLFNTARHFIVRRKDGIPAYHVASLTDDTDFDINMIVRGSDLLPSTAIQLYLAQVLQFPAFQEISFYHHPLISTEEGEKLSKSAGSTSIQSLRLGGTNSDAFIKEFETWAALFINI